MSLSPHPPQRCRDAAERLGVTESVISHQVRRLEGFCGSLPVCAPGYTAIEVGEDPLAGL